MGKAIKTKFVKILGVRKGVCPVCGYGVWIVENSQQVVPTEFIFSTKLVTDFDCQLDSIYNIATGIVVKEMKIVLGDCLNFKTIYRLDKRVKYPPNMRRIYYNMRSCRSIYRVDRDVICPEVEIAASDRISIIGKSKHANVHALFRTEKELDNNTITVCWKDYVSVMSQIYPPSSSLSLTPNQVLKTMLPLAAYGARGLGISVP